MERYIGILGLIVMVGIAFGLSENRRRIDWRLVAIGIGLQFALALLVLRTAVGERFFAAVRGGFVFLTQASDEGARFLFGNLTRAFTLKEGTVVDVPGPFFVNGVVAFSVLPTVIVMSALAAVLYHWRIIPLVIRGIAAVMQRTLRTSGPETFAASMLVFLGIESMATIKAYLHRMSRSELLTVMTAFMATVAASVLLIYATFGAEPGHLLAASLMSAPAAIVMAKILVPETVEHGPAELDVSRHTHNTFDAAAQGASEGVMLALNIGALLIAFISLVYIVDAGCVWALGVSVTDIVGFVFRPFARLMGVPAGDVAAVAQLLGTKSVFNEFLAYAQMHVQIAAGAIQPRSATIATYALCGFANPGSLGILIAGLTGLAPERRADITGLGLKALLGGTLAAFMTACIAGLLI